MNIPEFQLIRMMVFPLSVGAVVAGRLVVWVFPSAHYELAVRRPGHRSHNPDRSTEVAARILQQMNQFASPQVPDSHFAVGVGMIYLTSRDHRAVGRKVESLIAALRMIFD